MEAPWIRLGSFKVEPGIQGRIVEILQPAAPVLWLAFPFPVG